VLPSMLERGSGSIVNIASRLGQMGIAETAAYSAAKAGLIGLTRSLAREFGPKGIRINAVAPGVVETPMTADLVKSEEGQRRLRDMALGRFGFLLGDYIANAWLANFVWDNGYIFAGNFFGGALVNFRDLLGWNGIPGYIANALLGMVAGFAAGGPRRRFNDVYTLASTSVIAAFAITAAIAIVVYSAVPIYNSTYYSFGQATVALLDTAMPNLLVALVLLPLLLWLYDIAALR